MVKTYQEYLLNILQYSTTEKVRYIKKHVCFFSMFQCQSWIRVFFNIYSNFKPYFLLSIELNSFIIFCRMQDICGDIFTLVHSWQQSIVTLQYHVVQTRAFLGKGGVYTLIYPATMILMYWGFFLSLMIQIKIYNIFR